MNIYQCIAASILLIVTGCSNEKSNTPGREPTPQSSEQKTGSQLVAEAKQKLTEAKGRLAEEDSYGCCIKEPCNKCLLDRGKCSCYRDLKKGDPVCTECYVGWQHDMGADEQIRKGEVKTVLVQQHP